MAIKEKYELWTSLPHLLFEVSTSAVSLIILSINAVCIMSPPTMKYRKSTFVQPVRGRCILLKKKGSFVAVNNLEYVLIKEKKKNLIINLITYIL